MEGEMDFDPTTEEGQVDINDEEYDSLIPNDHVDPEGLFDKLTRRFGDRARSAWDSLRRKWQARNPDRHVPEYLQLQTFDTLEQNEALRQILRDPIEAAKERLSELYENFNFDEAKLSEKDDVVYIRFPDQRKIGKWTKPEKLFTEEGEIRDRVKNLKGFQMASRGLLGMLEDLNARVAAERTVEDLKETLDEREREYQRQNKLLLDGHGREKADLRVEVRRALEERDRARKAFDLAREELGMTRAEVDRLKTTIDGALHEREELLREISAKEEQLRQRDQAIEDLERQIGEQREILNDSARTEEEHAAAERELETLQERVAELQKQKDNLERELGLTTKEKIKRALLKYGVPLAFAVGIASAVGVIISMLKGTGSAVKKVGAGLANLGKKMAATLPGLLGSVLSLVLRTGGELLKFVGNNIWILVVALGAVFLKKIR